MASIGQVRRYFGTVEQLLRKALHMLQNQHQAKEIVVNNESTYVIGDV